MMCDGGRHREGHKIVTSTPDRLGQRIQDGIKAEIAPLFDELRRFTDRRIAELSAEIHATVQMVDFSETNLSGQLGKIQEQVAVMVAMPAAATRNSGLELEAVVQATEAAANQIMEAAEAIGEWLRDGSRDVASVELVASKLNTIFEACTFQDITGQRIRRAIQHLQQVETMLTEVMPHTAPDLPDTMRNGDGAGVNPDLGQDDVDLMFGERPGTRSDIARRYQRMFAARSRTAEGATGDRDGTGRHRPDVWLRRPGSDVALGAGKGSSPFVELGRYDVDRMVSAVWRAGRASRFAGGHIQGQHRLVTGRGGGMIRMTLVHRCRADTPRSPWPRGVPPPRSYPCRGLAARRRTVGPGPETGPAGFQAVQAPSGTTEPSVATLDAKRLGAKPLRDHSVGSRVATLTICPLDCWPGTLEPDTASFPLG